MTETSMSGRIAGRGAAVLLGGQWAKYVIQIASLVVLARILTPADYGLLAMVTSILGAATVIGDFGLSLAAIRAKVLSQEQKSNLFWINTMIGAISCAIIVVIATPVSNFYGEPRLVGLILVLSFIFPMNGIAVQYRVEMNRQGKFRWLAAIDVFSQLGGFVIALAMGLLGGGYWALAVQSVVSAIISLVLSITGAKWMPSIWHRNSGTRELLKFGANTSAVQIVNYISSNLDSVLIGRVLGATILGLYNRAFQLVSLPIQQLAAPLTRVALPYLARMSSQKEFEGACVKAQLVLSYGLVGILSLIASTSQPLLAVALGNEWSGSWPILEILALGGLFQSLGYVYYWIFLTTAKTGMLFLSELSGRVVMAILMLCLVQFGAQWIALSGAVGLFIVWLVATMISLPLIKVKSKPLVQVAIRPMVVFASAYAIVKLCRLWASPLLLSASGSLLYLLVLSAIWIVWVGLFLAIIPKYRDDVILILKLGKQVFGRSI